MGAVFSLLPEFRSVDFASDGEGPVAVLERGLFGRSLLFSVSSMLLLGVEGTVSDAPPFSLQRLAGGHGDALSGALGDDCESGGEDASAHAPLLPVTEMTRGAFKMSRGVSGELLPPILVILRLVPVAT